MNLISSSSCPRRGRTAGVALAVLVTVSACGTDVPPPKQDIGTVVDTKPDRVTIDDCLDTTRPHKVATCPYPVQSGDRFSRMRHRKHY